MDKAEKEKALQRMRAALKEGREKRRNDLDKHREDVDHERALTQVSYNSADELNRALDQASDRNMLATVKLRMQSGEEKTVEIGHVKDREPYQKRPSTRALKKSRSLGPEV